MTLCDLSKRGLDLDHESLDIIRQQQILILTTHFALEKKKAYEVAHRHRPDLVDEPLPPVETIIEKIALIPEVSISAHSPSIDCVCCASSLQEAHEKGLWTPLSTPRYRAFSILWERGYFVTTGTKFGGDFIVYTGDPIRNHSSQIVVPLSPNQLVRVTDLITRGRLGTNVNKQVVLCGDVPMSSAPLSTEAPSVYDDALSQQGELSELEMDEESTRFVEFYLTWTGWL